MQESESSVQLTDTSPQHCSMRDFSFGPVPVYHGMALGSVLRPSPFIIYVLSLGQFICYHCHTQRFFNELRKSKMNLKILIFKKFKLQQQESLTYLLASEKFKYEDSQGPAISSKVMAFVHDDLWGHILWCPTECPCLLSKANLFSKAKVCLRKCRRISNIFYTVQRMLHLSI